MLIRSALPGLRLLRRCFTRRQPTGHILTTLTFHLPNGGVGKLHLFDCGRGGSAILSNISSFILDGQRNKYSNQSEPLQALLREALGSTNNDICLIPHIDGAEPQKSVAVLQAVSRMHKVRSNVKRARPSQPEISQECRSPVNSYAPHNISSCSEATSQDTAIFVGRSHKSHRGYQSDGDFTIQITPLEKQLKGVHAPRYQNQISSKYPAFDSYENLLELPLPQTKTDNRPPVPVRSQTKIFLSDQELSGVDSGHEELIVTCKPKAQPKTYARTRALPLMSETEDESSKAKRRHPVIY
jgi:hypothetical protein